MDLCAHCGQPIDGARVGDPRPAAGWHPACAAARLPGDALVAALGLVLMLVAPTVVVWAG